MCVKNCFIFFAHNNSHIVSCLEFHKDERRQINKLFTSIISLSVKHLEEASLSSGQNVPLTLPVYCKIITMGCCHKPTMGLLFNLGNALKYQLF